MGIPSYYRTLITKIPHAIQRKAPTNAGSLVVDMNCMIYHVLREPRMASHIYPGTTDPVLHRAWERKLQDEVCSYLTHIWMACGAPSRVYVGLDGVVPYAKIKQQRYRRFKSSNSMSDDTSTWDTNAITPGTEFMAAMGRALDTTGAKHGWVISGTDEPGEGEHKLLQWLRTTEPVSGSIVVYGLDADLILLCLLAGNTLTSPIVLVREAMAFGKMIRLEGSNQVELGFFQVNTLRESLQRGKEWSKEQFYDYIFGMSFCGNDFLPTGLSLRIRDEGHAILLSGLEYLWRSRKHLVTFTDDGLLAKPNPEGLLAFAKWMSEQEERLILTTIKRKMTARMGESEEDNLPLREQAEHPLVEGVVDRLRLRSDWEKTYARLALYDTSIEHRKKRVSDFWQGWCWVLDYYQGLPVDLEWVYPSGYPPTWKDLCEYFSLPETGSSIINTPLQPKEQLALVLPLRSWGLLLKTEFRNLPAKLPQYWPQEFALETFGKRFGWECEPMIPMLPPSRMRFEVARMNPIR